MPISWNDKAHVKLLVAILHTTNARLDFAAIANYMGPGCTVVAIRLHIQQLKRQVAEASGSIPATPRNQARNRVTSQDRRRMRRMQQREERQLEETSNDNVEDAKSEDVKEEDEMIEDIEEDVKSEDIKEEVFDWLY